MYDWVPTASHVGFQQILDLFKQRRTRTRTKGATMWHHTVLSPRLLTRQCRYAVTPSWLVTLLAVELSNDGRILELGAQKSPDSRGSSESRWALPLDLRCRFCPARTCRKPRPAIESLRNTFIHMQVYQLGQTKNKSTVRFITVDCNALRIRRSDYLRGNM